MARSRNIKPGFFKNELLADLGPMAQILFAGLWCLADREGRLKDRPRFIKAEIFPYYDCDVNGELTELERLGFVARYSADGESCIEIKNFKKHQSPHNTERPSELPEPPADKPANPDPARLTVDNGDLTVNSRKDNDGNPPDSLCTDSLFTDSLIPDEAPPAVPAVASTRGTRLPKDWTLPVEWAEWAVSERPGYPVVLEAAKFRDHWHAKSGKEAAKADWLATWRNWVRNTRQWAPVKQDRHGGFAARDYHEGVTPDGKF